MLPPAIGPLGPTNTPVTRAPGCSVTVASVVALFTRQFTTSAAAIVLVAGRKSTNAYVRFCRPVIVKLPVALVNPLGPPLLGETVTPLMPAPLTSTTRPVSDCAAVTAASAARTDTLTNRLWG